MSREDPPVTPVSAVILLLLCLMSAAGFCGCGGARFESLGPGLDQRGHHIKGVIFYHQGDNSCGPAALASVASYWGRTVKADRIAADVYLPELGGTLPMDMERYLRKAKFNTSSFSGSLDDVKKWVSLNVPVICLLDLGFSVYHKPHYVTVIGFDDVNEVIIAHDGIQANKVIRYEKFMSQWARAGNWMLLAVPPEKDRQ